MIYLYSKYGGVLKWLKGPDSKSGRVGFLSQEFKSLRLRQQPLPTAGVCFFESIVYEIY